MIARLRPLAVAGFYLIVAAIALDALVANFGTAMPGIVTIQASDQIQPSEFDIFLWNLWWVRRAVLDLHVSPLYTNHLVYPFTSPLAGHTLALLWGILSAPFQPVLGLIATYNGLIVSSFVAAGTFTYLFVRRHVRHESVAALAGLIFAFTPAMLHRASVGHLDKLSIFWLPLVLLVWDKVVETRRWTWAAVLGLCLYLSWLTDFQQTMWALLLLVPYALYTMVKPQSHRATEPLKALRASVPLRLILLVFAAFLVPALFAPLPQLLEANRLNYPPARLEDTVYFGFPLRNFLVPDDNGDFSIGVLLPLLALVAVPLVGRNRQRWLWLGIAIACLLLALGPYVDVGSVRVPLPYALVHVALGNQYRTPMRFATPGVLALAMLVALTLDRLISNIQLQTSNLKLQTLKSRLHLALIAALALLFVLDYRLLEPFPITHMPDYQAYRDIAAEPGEFAVLDIPIGVRTGFAIVGRGEYLQYYQPIHQRPIPAGYLSRLPNEIMDHFFYDPLVGSLTLSHALPPMAEVDARLERLIRDWNVGYVILHRDLLEPGRVKAFTNLLDRQPALERAGEEGPLLIYRATAP
ncbi:MAG TPA: hypothetical protein VJ793_18340 [Anaerolineae bacterium]|nr:hypothetical protein [Anaerolineae bacterium]